MDTLTFASYAALCEAAADRVAALAATKPDARLCLPTGNTPLGLFRALARRSKEGAVDLSQAVVVELDEYLGVPRGDERNLADWLTRELLAPCGVARAVLFDALAQEPCGACAAIERAIADLGGLDLTVLGLGPNGHVGFNEPGSHPASRARVVRLAEDSIASNARYWGDPARVPRYGMTLGIGTLLESREVIVLASGPGKSDIVRRLAAAPADDIQLPAAMLKAHPRFTLMTAEL